MKTKLLEEVEMTEYIDGRRIRGYCNNCGAPVFGNKVQLCWQCHTDRKRAQFDDARQQTRENILQSKRNWYYNNLEKAKATSNAWKANNKEKTKQYEQEHIEQRRAYVETRRARLLAADEGVTATIWKLLIDIYDNRCAYCFQKFDSLEQDHVIPLSKGGKHSVTNVVPACLSCNRIKSTALVPPIHPMYEFIVNKFSNPSVEVAT